MPRCKPFGIGLGLVALLFATGAEPKPIGTTLSFSVTVAKDLKTDTRDGRLLVVMDRGKRGEPYRSISETGMDASPLLGRDVTNFVPGAIAIVDQTAAIFPIASL